MPIKVTWTLDNMGLPWYGEIADQQPALQLIIGAAREPHGVGIHSYTIMMGVRVLDKRGLLKMRVVSQQDD